MADNRADAGGNLTVAAACSAPDGTTLVSAKWAAQPGSARTRILFKKSLNRGQEMRSAGSIATRIARRVQVARRARRRRISQRSRKKASTDRPMPPIAHARVSGPSRAPRYQPAATKLDAQTPAPMKFSAAKRI